ncbi:HAD family hydrolase [Simiduia aestuariiviva]|uniref:HAD superfamily hydrolase (TIGR01509 family) n=1 Tax=Simiduia aestuariiviva TaxID=1510459 RepID=A0A839URF9_9GAMM|nr:HAD-IA family hydrolase [Simiduia aestuariiviva]MBB3169301.1 HAD superfamily hydrolase (TIGR01509 family) [Simiduia aestuariiviva]
MSSSRALIIFDCDGVLVDSETIANRVLAEHLRGAGVNVTDAEVQARFKGNSAAQCQALIAQWLGSNAAAALWSELQQRTLEALAQVAPIEGIEAVLSQLRAQGLKFCVASAGDYEKMAVTLGATGLRDAYDLRCFSAVDVAHSKPAPDLFLWAARTMEATPEQCMVIEDSEQGVMAALAAKMAVCWFQVGERREAPEGVQVFSRMAELPPLIAQWRENQWREDNP